MMLPHKLKSPSTMRGNIKPPVLSLTQPTRNGPAKPAKFPTELISASPAAIAVPRRKSCGMDQNGPRIAHIPLAATAIRASFAHIGRPGRPELAIAIAPIIAGIAI